MTASPRYTIVRALDAWHVFDTRRDEPVAFTAVRIEAHAHALAKCYNHYWHLTQEHKNGTPLDTNPIIHHP